MPLAQTPLLVVTRFSFLGKSGWKSDFSRDAALLFDPARLARRFELFRAVTLASLAAQRQSDFHHLILTAEALPQEMLGALHAAALSAYGTPERFTVVAAPPSPAHVPLTQFMSERWPGQIVAQVVLDDDDGLASEFIGKIRSNLASLEQDVPQIRTQLPYVMSFAVGYALLMRDGETSLHLHRYPWINAGLTLLGLAEGRNIFAIEHKKAAAQYGGRLLGPRPMFLRSVHELNDSRVAPSDRWRRVNDWHSEGGLAARFPLLFAQDVPWVIPAPASPNPDPDTGPNADPNAGSETGPDC